MNRKRNIYIESKKGKLVALLLTCFVLMLSVGYTALNENLTISGEASFRVEEDIRVTKINILETTNNALEDYSPNYSKDSIKVGITLPNNNSTVKYKVKVTNYSNCAIKITSIVKSVTNNNYNISFNKTLPLKMSKLSEEEIEITFSNNTNESQTIESTLKFTFEKLEAVMAIGSTGSSNVFYRGPIARNTVESITFMSSKDVPNDAIGYWDCSYTQGANEVIAYYLDEDEDNLYELYIGADGEVYAPSSSGNLFHSFNNVTSINFNNSFNTKKATTMGGNSNGYGMFSGCSSLLSLDLRSFDTSKVTNMYRMFASCSNLESVNLSSFDTSRVSEMGSMFLVCSKLKSLDLSNFNTYSLTSISDIFNQCSLLESIDFGNNFDTSKIKSLRCVFFNCSKLKELDLSGFRTADVTSMYNTFRNCSSLEELDLSGFDVGNVTDVTSLFGGCTSLTKLNVSGWSNNKLTSISGMFSGLSNLEEINLTNFSMPNITNISWMFGNDIKLTTINLSSFDIDITSMYNTFGGCTSLTNLYIQNMDFENKTVDTTNIFKNVPSGVNIYVKNAYNQNFIQGLKSNANVIIYIPPEEELEES